MALIVKSKSFCSCGDLPIRFTGEGEDVSPPLEWSGVPENCRSLVVLCEDRDAPARIGSLWVLFNLASAVCQLQEKAGRPETSSAAGGVHGKNDSGKLGYSGPKPRFGSHRYYFKIFALDTQLPLEAGVTREDVLKAMEGHVVDSGECIAVYTRGSARPR